MTDLETLNKTILPKLAELGNALKQIRQNIPMTQEAVADWLNVGVKRISEVEAGKSNDLELILAYCDKLSVDVKISFEVN